MVHVNLSSLVYEMISTLNPEDTTRAMTAFIDYYNQFESISDYQRFVRIQRTRQRNPGASSLGMTSQTGPRP